jgi:hypothetical protein
MNLKGSDTLQLRLGNIPEQNFYTLKRCLVAMLVEKLMTTLYCHKYS